MSTRQAESIARIRSARRAQGRCPDCGVQCNTYRCAACNAARRKAARLLMRARRNPTPPITAP